MQEWMIAMLVISIMLIIRDMAKTILAENLPDTEEFLSLQEGHPQKERVEKYAASFQKLADTFYGMPYRRDYLSSRQIERIIGDTNAKVCSRCYQREISLISFSSCIFSASIPLYTRTHFSDHFLYPRIPSAST